MATDDNAVTGLGGRYATALFELAHEAKALDAVAADLGRIEAMLRDSDDLRRLVASPVLSRADQGRAMAAILAAMGAHALVRSALGLMAEKRRLFALADVIRSYRRLLARRRGEVAAEVTSARSLSAEQKDAIAQALKSALGRAVTVETRVDAALIGGLVVRVGSRMIDNSLRTKLQRLQFAMKGIG
ncbi:MAG: F0F1 ATP synthase subunit delta [Alphaproteobacteria bacterium]